MTGAGATHSGIDPAFAPWVRLLEVALRAAEDPAWSAVALSLDERRRPGAPLLDGAVLVVDEGRVRALLAELGAIGADRIDALALLAAAIAGDAAVVALLGGEAGAEHEALDVLAQLAATPVLVALATHLRAHADASWGRGYCPVCGAWPALAELRGLERQRRLRCGRCASDWALPVLTCAFCGETDHERLRTLVVEGQEQTRRIEACDGCRGYLKSVSTLRGMPLRTLAMADLASVELDLVAQEHGYERPEAMGWAVRVVVAPRSSGSESGVGVGTPTPGSESGVGVRTPTPDSNPRL